MLGVRRDVDINAEGVLDVYRPENREKMYFRYKRRVIKIIDVVVSCVFFFYNKFAFPLAISPAEDSARHDIIIVSIR